MNSSGEAYGSRGVYFLRKPTIYRKILKKNLLWLPVFLLCVLFGKDPRAEESGPLEREVE